MWIESLELYTRQLAPMLDFYSKILELSVLEQKPERFVVSAGETMLTFSQAQTDAISPCHYAFNIPEAAFGEAKHWLQQRVPLLTDGQGTDEFHSENWNAHLIYYADSDGNIGEFSARHTLPGSNTPRSTSNPILRVAEIGIAVDDVPDFVGELERVSGLLPYRQNVESTFTAVGDENGLFIVVKTGRMWFPNQVLAAQPVPLNVMFKAQAAETSSRFELSGPPYTLSAVST
jgi:catechol 2,3-dioxygenase-like lactoylglutathione lyase family enzyme